MDVFEQVEVTDRPHRLKYSYHLQVDDTFERADFDPLLPPDIQYHVNRPGGTHEPATRITLARMVELCWAMIEELRAAANPDAV